MTLPSKFILNNKQELPAVGLGTFQGEGDNSGVKDAVLRALKIGYRHIDGAYAYGNEKEIGEAIRESKIPREKIFVTTKLAQTWHEPADVEEALNLSLEALQLDYVDLYLMHFPHAYKPGENHATIRHLSGDKKPVIDHDLSRRYTDTWQAMEKLVDSGKARAIGLSNFNVLKTKRILEVARIKPVVNQVEIHPYLPQKELFEFSKKEGILLMAHQPLGGRPVPQVRGHPDVPPPTQDPEIIEIAEKNGISPAQVCLSWLVQRGIPVVPKSVQDAHMQANFELSKLSVDAMAVVDRSSERVGGPKRFLDPSRHIGFDIFDEANDQPVEGL